MNIILRFDGGTHGGNPGPGYGSYELVECNGSRQNRLLKQSIEFEVWMTNNQAEYRTLLAAIGHLYELKALRAKTVQLLVCSDSQLVINQIAGHYQCKDDKLGQLRREAVEALRQFGHTRLRWEPRAVNVKTFGH